jgi:hypothetical protein
LKIASNLPKEKACAEARGHTDTSSSGQASRHSDYSLGGADQHFFGVIGAVAAVGNFLALKVTEHGKLLLMACQESLGGCRVSMCRGRYLSR